MRANGVKIVFGLGLILVAAGLKAQIDVPTRDAKGAAGALTGQGSAQLKEDLYKTESKSIPYTTKIEFSRSVGAGRMVKRQAGQNGKVVSTYRLIEDDGKVVGKELIKTERVEPTPEIVHVGRQGFTTSRSSFDRSKVMTMHASAYDPSAGRGSRATFRTATGLRAQYGVVAVDPRVIPLGTHLYVEGYGFAKAADTGGAIKGNRIDLCYNSYGEAIRFGRKSVRVHILK